jgi:hypothetical protein
MRFSSSNFTDEGEVQSVMTPAFQGRRATRGSHRHQIIAIMMQNYRNLNVPHLKSETS